MKSVLVLFSGGLDSYVMAKRFQEQGFKVEGLYIDYGQPWKWEEIAAYELANSLNMLLHKETVSFLSTEQGIGKFVPMRNAVLLSLAINLAYTGGIKNVAIGVNVTQMDIADQSAEFIDRFNFMAQSAFPTDRAPWVIAPFCNYRRGFIVKLGMKYGLDLSKTVSCMVSKEPCGVCLKCRQRQTFGIDKKPQA